MYQKSCVGKMRYFYFKNQRKEEYIRNYMSAPQYKPGENTEIHVHIFAS